MTKALVILCGGKSSRMGTDKAFLPFGKTTLLDYQIGRFRSFFDKIYLSVSGETGIAAGQTGHDARETYGDCPVIRDLRPNLGPLGGLYSCLSAAAEDILCFIPVDAPFLDPLATVSLCRTLAAAPDKHVCAARASDGRLHPFPLACAGKALPDIEGLLREKTYKLRLLLDSDQTLAAGLTLSEEQLFNMNDPKSYYLALQRLARSAPDAFPCEISGAADTRQADKGDGISGNSGSRQADTDDRLLSRAHIPAISFVAQSGTGKTTYLEKLIPLLKQEGLRVAVIKHDAHGFEIDRPGKDSYRLTKAGADHMILSSQEQTAAIFTHKKEAPRLSELLSKIEHVDLIVTEGYKAGDLPKICLLRKGYSETPPAHAAHVIAYAADFPYRTTLPVFDLNDPRQIVPFLKNHLRILF